MTTKNLLQLTLAVCVLGISHMVSASALDQFKAMDNAGLLVVSEAGNELMNKRGEDAFIPASTTKIVTGFLALEHWGEDHQFTTDFFYDDARNILWVQGSGDPFLVSEEIAVIAENLAARLSEQGVSELAGIGLDMQLFANQLVLPGTGSTNNPYDAVPSAIAANFNTVNIKKVNGTVVSAEAQTPLTPYAASMANRFKKGKLRVNTGRNPRHAGRYFAELLSAFLAQNNIAVAKKMVFGSAPDATVFYQHQNSKTVGEVVQPMMKYSTNFIANQLILMLAAEHYGAPVDSDKVQRYLQTQLAEKLDWQSTRFEEGAGLSRNNQVSPAQLVQLLEAFRPYRHLLPEVEPGVFAKSGTLSGVSTLAGYIVVDGQWHSFALMMNQSVAYKLRNRIARELRNAL